MAPSWVSPRVVIQLSDSIPAVKIVAGLVREKTGTDPIKNVRAFMRSYILFGVLLAVMIITVINMIFGLVGSKTEAQAFFIVSAVGAFAGFIVMFARRNRKAWNMFTRALDTLCGRIFINLLDFPNLFKIQTHAALLIAKAAERRAQAEQNVLRESTLVTRTELAEMGDAFLATYDALSIIPGLGLEESYLRQAREDLKKKK